MQPHGHPTVLYHGREGRNLLKDLHSGACGHHTTPRTLIENVFRQSFYWPIAVSDAVKLVRSCKGC
jgi:hypothetical protein